jgi:hypothetical protein
MMTKYKLSSALLLTLAISACGPFPATQQATVSTPILSSSQAQADGSSVEVRIDTGATLQTKAAKKTTADIHHYYVQLVNTVTGAVVADGETTQIVNFFHKVPNGTYRVVVDAINANGNSIVQGGAQTSSNYVTVASPDVTYSDSANCLRVRLKLLDATGESVGSKIIVEDGHDWTGQPEMSPGGSCPCPTPTPTPDPTPTPTASAVPHGPQITTGQTTNSMNAWGDPFSTGEWRALINAPSPAWVERDFGGTYDVSRIEIDYFWAGGGEALDAVTIELRKPDGTWTTVETRQEIQNPPYAKDLSQPIQATAMRVSAYNSYAPNYGNVPELWAWGGGMRVFQPAN